jgi:putative transposase
MNAVNLLAQEIGLARACSVLRVNRSTVYREDASRRHLIPLSTTAPRPPRPDSPLALSEAERLAVLAVLNSERFADCAPAAIYATLLDEGCHLCSARTMYRLLASSEQIGDRRNQRIHPVYAKPELLATQSNQVWSWDITKLKGPAKWTYFHLYVILDIFSRYVVGWMIAHRETAQLAESFHFAVYSAAIIHGHPVMERTLAVSSSRRCRACSK